MAVDLIIDILMNEAKGQFSSEVKLSTGEYNSVEEEGAEQEQQTELR